MALTRVGTELDTVVAELDGVPAHGKGPVRLDENGDLVIGPLSAEDVPVEAAELKDELTGLLPFAPIASVLIELDRRTGFLDCFTDAKLPAGSAVGDVVDIREREDLTQLGYGAHLGRARLDEVYGPGVQQATEFQQGGCASFL